MNNIISNQFRAKESNIFDIRVYNKSISIFDVHKEDEEICINIEKYLRQYFSNINKEKLIFLANFLYHESPKNLTNYSSEEIFNIMLEAVQDTDIYIVKNLNEIDTATMQGIVKIVSEDANVYLYCSNDVNDLFYNYNFFECYKNNIFELNNMGLNEKKYYLKAEEDVFKSESSKNSVRAINLLMLLFPKYIYRLDKEVVKKDLWKETVISRLYHENSKLRTFHQQGDFMKPLDEIDEEVKTLTAFGRKTYLNNIRVKLPEPTKECKLSVEDLVLERRSRRHYKQENVKLQTLSNILYYSYGITGKLEKTKLLLRAVPSGGGLYPVDIYIAINNVEDIERGIYYYDPFEHEIVLVNNKDLTEISTEISGYSAMIDTAAFTFILGANFWRNQWKYHERGYRVILIDCGHVAQNLHMMATAYDLGSCCLMGFVDDELDTLLELDGIVEHSMYMITVGVNR